MTSSETAGKPPTHQIADCYDILDLYGPKHNVSAVGKAEIKQAYRLALLSNHPDKSQAAHLAHRSRARYTIDELSRAYRTLIDPERRLEHDRQLQLEPRVKPDQNHAQSHPGIDMLDLDEFNADDSSGKWHCACRCGDDNGFNVTEDELQTSSLWGETIIECRSCSLRLRVTFATVEDDGRVVSTVQGADPRKLSDLVKKIAAEADSDGSGGFGEASDPGTGWLGADLSKGYDNVTDQVDVRGLDFLNADSNFASARALFDATKPSALQDSKGKGSAPGGDETKDWAESDTDEQLMLFIPFQSTLKVHSLHITSLPTEGTDAAAAEVSMRPKTIQLYSNRAHVLGFEEADDIEATQVITLQPQDWDATTGTVNISLRYVKFQNVSSLVLFVVDGDGDGERVRIDRLRIVGEKGSKRELGKLEKIGDETGE
ncbi:MAG: hypothetical protein Q9168_005682 [Polycauliona sp. 1 TL-2023]